jgi:hypothetical protein
MGLTMEAVDWNLWLRFSGIPETYDVSNREPISSGYPLRPGDLFISLPLPFP